MAAPNSFKKKTRGKSFSVPGTKLSLQNAQLLTSTGVQSFDYVLGGGIPLGTVLLVEEDSFGHYAKLLIRYFIAEGMLCKHKLFLAAGDIPSSSILQEIPGARENSQLNNPATENPMKIAMRYESVPTVKTLCEKSDFAHQFDLSRHMTIEKDDVVTFDVSSDHASSSPSSDNQNSYRNLLQRIKKIIESEGFSTSTDSPHTNLLRIAIHSLGSPLWSDDSQHIFRFLHALRALLRAAFAVCIVTVPSYLVKDEVFSERLIRLGDTSVTLESFEGSDKAKNPLFREYHGLFHVHYRVALNSLVEPSVDFSDLAFKVKRHNFVIEKLHLPPDLSETANRPQEDPVTNKNLPFIMACGGAGRNKLDF